MIVTFAAALTVFAATPAATPPAPAKPPAAARPAAAPAAAGATQQFTVLDVSGPVAGTPINVDAKFAKDHAVSVPAPFATVAPVHSSFQTLVANGPKPGTAFLLMRFTALDGKSPLEDVLFAPLEIPMGPVDQRLQKASEFLSTAGVLEATRGQKNPTVKVVRQIKSGPYDAVEIIGTYDGATTGQVYYRLLGILNPKSKDCVTAVSTVVMSRVNVVTADDFLKTRSGVATQNLRFIQKP